MEEVLFLSVDDVLLLHRDTIDSDGGSHGVRDYGLLDAAGAMPRQQFGGKYLHEDVAAMAAAYMLHIAQNHPFVDGNKRAAVLSALVFLNVNGIETLPDPKELESVTLQLAAGEMGKDILTRWLRNQISGKK
ncbi:type II toxin-antitoxin system death-on-curing family toxin [Nitrospira sp. BLG_1]|uniref:type II toxin-antitoxin system death-on-curing family toxin n=1 Tax=Nitrospira sp. BLG_1 TaxID=3395883 RepID=UPI0039BC7B84